MSFFRRLRGLLLPIAIVGCSAGGSGTNTIVPNGTDAGNSVTDMGAGVDIVSGLDVTPVGLNDSMVDGTGDSRAGDGPVADSGPYIGVDIGSLTDNTCDGGHASVTGFTLAPNGVDPIPGVRVILLPNTTTFPAAPTSVTCDHCVAVPPAAIASFLSVTNGSFTMQSPALDLGGTFTFEMLSGGFRHVVRSVTVPRCGSVALTAAQTSFSGATMGEDTIPTIAVAGIAGAASGGNNVNDNFIAVLSAIGITGYDIYDPDRSYPTIPDASTTPHIHDLLAGTAPTPLSHYQILILPCGTLGNYTVATNFAAPMVTNVSTWLNAGGRLYASDLSYPFIDQAFSGGITFAPGPSSHVGAPPGDQGVGQGTAAGDLASPLNATVDDPSLQAWLNAIGSTTGNVIPITELKNPWGAVSLIPPAELMPDHLGSIPGKVWVSGDVLWNGVTGAMSHPLTVQVDYPGPTNLYCGRVAFTSYHVQTASAPGMPATALSPQERVLEYLFFQLTTCIQCSLTAGCTMP